MAATWIRPELVGPSLHESLSRLDGGDPWERALTMQGLAQTTPDLPEALRWGRASGTLFRETGDDMHAANALFIMAQRAIYGGIVDDEVHAWLTESRALAEATGSEEDRAHATVGFAQLAWARGEHDDAADLMRDCLPTLRRPPRPFRTWSASRGPRSPRGTCAARRNCSTSTWLRRRRPSPRSRPACSPRCWPTRAATARGRSTFSPTP
jgi:hypothetical protein